MGTLYINKFCCQERPRSNARLVNERVTVAAITTFRLDTVTPSLNVDEVGAEEKETRRNIRFIHDVIL
jgi:hypothetical protein